MAAKRSVIEILFKGKDQASSSVKKLNRQLDKTGKKLTRVTAKANLFTQILKSMAVARTVSFGISSMTLGMRALADEYLNLDQSLRTAGAKFGGIKKGTKLFQEMEEAAREVGATTEFTSAEAAEGLKFMAMAGFDAKNAIGALPVLTDLATASGADFARTSDIATDALGAFAMTSSDAATQTKNLKEISDVLTRTISESNVTTEHWYETMKQAGAVATSAGSDVQTFSAMTGIMGNAGIKASRAGTTLKNAFLRLVKPPKEAAKALAKYNINFQENGKLRDMVSIVEDMEKKFAKLTPIQRDAAMGAIFGRYAISGMNTIMNTGSEELRKFRDRLYAANGTTAEMARIMRGSAINQLKTLKSTVFEVGLQAIETFGKRFPNAIQDTIKWFRGIDKEKLVGVIGTIADEVKSVVGWFNDWKGVLWDLVKVWTALSIAAKTSAILGLTGAIRGAAVASTTLAGGMTAASTAMGATSFSLMPILALAAGVGVLAANWGTVTANVKKYLKATATGEKETFLGSAIASGMSAIDRQDIMNRERAVEKARQKMAARVYTKQRQKALSEGGSMPVEPSGAALKNIMGVLDKKGLLPKLRTQSQIDAEVASNRKHAKLGARMLVDDLAYTYFGSPAGEHLRSKYDFDNEPVSSRNGPRNMDPTIFSPKTKVDFNLTIKKPSDIDIEIEKRVSNNPTGVSTAVENFPSYQSQMGEN